MALDAGRIAEKAIEMQQPAHGPSTRPSEVDLVYEGRHIRAHAGQRLLDALLAAGADHRHICGGRGFCTSCRVEILDGDRNVSPVSLLERIRLGPAAGHQRLACQTTLHGPARICVPRVTRARFSPDGE